MRKTAWERLSKAAALQTGGRGDGLVSPTGLEPGADVRWTRRSFLQTLGGLGAASALLPFSLNSKGVEAPATNSVWHFAGNSRPRYRAVSWWLVFEDLAWPNQGLMDKVRRRADTCVENGVNCCIIYGAHCRWDYLPIWGRLHDLIHFVADELHQRKILLFDHHSNCVVTRPRDRKGALHNWNYNRHQLPFYPSVEEAERWQFNGSRLNDWRMIDVGTGQPVFLSTYDAEQFCMNNPNYRAAYQKYVSMLLKETGVDGLESDDGLFYADWHACGCEHCRKRFQKDYGHDLPPVTDTHFWGNRESEAFRDWIAMRFQSAGDFLKEVRKVLPPEFPLQTCCSNSERQTAPAYGMSYQDFIHSCNQIMLEMTGSIPTVNGTWDDRIASQLLHTGIARDHNAACMGLGYAFFPDPTFFVWAINKFLGSDTWASSEKGRLTDMEEEFKVLQDDPELVGEGYRWEKTRPQLFVGEADTSVGVFFSRATRDYYGQISADYVDDFSATCTDLLHSDITYDVWTEIPEFGRIRFLILSSTICLSAAEREGLSRFMNSGGTVIATGPVGHRDERANLVSKPWLEDFGVHAEINDPPRPGAFPPYSNVKSGALIAQSRISESDKQQMRDGWISVSVKNGRLWWRPERIRQNHVSASVIEMLQAQTHPGVMIKGLAAGWQTRRYREGNRILVHALPRKVGIAPHPTLKWAFGGQPIVEKLQFTPLEGEITVEASPMSKEVVLHSPDLSEPRAGRSNGTGGWSVDLSKIARYFVLEIVM
jgi:hypothetical protein